ncbi:uncharacterized protein [Procambarus clarkii]|uniref:uncharacterized protein n=1 Tax=Procambarus clarkii TaxID=6728 RepID=UPI00374275BF
MKCMYLLMLLCVSLVNAAAIEGDVGDEELQPAVNDENNEDDVEDEGTASDELAVNLRNGTGCSPRTSCQNADGTCKPTCNEATESEVADGCAGNGCKCCVNTSLRQAPCRNLCQSYNGNCRQNSCGKKGYELKISCFPLCICCLPPPKNPPGVIILGKNENGEEA